MKANRKEAWAVAREAWNALPEVAKSLVMAGSMGLEDAEIARGGIFLPRPSVVGAFSETPSPLLAGIALASSCFTSWDLEAWTPERLGIMRVSQFADQTLSRRLGLPEAPEENPRPGVSLSVSQGLLRIEWDVRNKHGGYVLTGLATEGLVAVLSSTRFPRHPGAEEHHHDLQDWSFRVKAIALHFAGCYRPMVGFIGKLFDTGMIDNHEAKEKSDVREAAPEAPRSKGKAQDGPRLFIRSEEHV